ncbi:DNA independent RNA polymerase I transcription factor, partial [Massospora cicadina]
SRHAQFVMFYLCSLQPQFADAFLGVLFDQLASNDTPRVTRIASAAYLSSFTARAKFLNDVDVIKVATLLLNWLGSYMENTPAADIRLDPNSHALFYAVTQA